MTIGISGIGYHISTERVNTLEKAQLHDLTSTFIKNKIGFVSLARKASTQKASDLCVLAYDDLFQRTQNNALLNDIEFICVCTQNGDYQLPQTSAIVQDKLGISSMCASFDISMGCSGYVYSLHIAKSFMESNGFKKGLLFTSDPYSDIVDPKDKHTSLLFGDGATVTLLTDKPIYEIGNGVFETHGNYHEHLIKNKNLKLQMNGRGIFNFTMLSAPDNVSKCLKKNSLSKKHIDVFLLHQASKYIIDNLCMRMKLDPVKVPFLAKDYGNTVSSSIPIGLKIYLDKTEIENILICGFGVGLSIASSIIRRR